MNDVIKISRGTTKQDELFDYARIPSCYKTNKHYEKDKDDYEMSL